MKFYVLFSAFLLIYTFSVHSASIPLNDEEFIECNYFGGSDGANYECIMTIVNPNGIEFDAVGGTHLPGLTNDDVLSVDAFHGTSKIVPSIICRQFPNIFHLTIMGIDVEELTPAAFEDCRNLREIFFLFNLITTVPANTFANSALLEYIELSRNNIVELNENSFAGTALNFIAIDYNQIATFNQDWFTAVNGTLRHLELMNNQLRELGPNAFSNLRELTELNFNYNTLTSSISSTAFDGLTNLQSLSLSRIGLTSIDPLWFNTLQSLTSFHAQNNEITQLVNETFSSLTSLEQLFLNGNQIREIMLAAFGPSTASLHTFYISDNRINLVDPYWVNEAENLEYLLLAGNLCINEDFLNVGLMRWRLFEELQQCIDNFMLPSFLSCNYVLSGGSYRCELRTHNPNGRNDFEAIEGEHVGGQNDLNVTQLSAFYSNTRIIPSILCQRFVNLDSIMILSSNIEDLSEENFDGCVNLNMLFLHDNWIRQVPDFTFRNNPNLWLIDLGMNQISTFGENAFTGSRASTIDLDINRLMSFDPRWVLSVNSSLESLNLFGNSIVMLEFDTFEELRNLQSLTLAGNPIWSIPANVFDPLTNLTFLNLAELSLTLLNPSWFRNLQNLDNLQIHANQIGHLQDGVFDGLSRMRFISITNNNLRSLSANAFGTSLESLMGLYFDNNRIRAFDERILDESTNLSWLTLRGNVCTDEEFNMFDHDIEFIKQRLARCTTNFGPERIECRYYQPGEEYTCSLNIFNPLGADEFTDIDGEHMEGRTDADVQRLYVNDGQKTLNVPSILCQKFSNLISIDFIHDEIEYVLEDTFSNCASLRRVYIFDNMIESLPNGLFSNNPLLEEVSFSRNRLTARGIPSNIFGGTQLNFLDLSQNPIQDFNSDWIIPVASTLRTLEIYDIQATHLPILFFNNPSVLETLEVSNNPLREIIPAVFDRLPTLKFLDLANCQFRQINPNWFRELGQLETLRVSGNQILDIPPNAFNVLTNLTTLYIYNNKLRELNVESFGPSISSLRYLYTQSNEITGVDPTFLSSATNLQILYLSGNRCAQDNFYDVSANTSIVADAIGSCIEAFSAETISCDYNRNAQGAYVCIMSTFNPLGRNNFARIEGEHLAGSSDDDVEFVDMRDQNTRIVPSIICRQYTNLRTLIIFRSQLDLFTERNLDECRQLTGLLMYQNDLFEIPNYSFQNNDNLEYLEIGFNRITRLDDFSFTGAPISFLDLAGNDLGRFDPRWFEVINSTLVTLDLVNTNIRELPQNGFRNLRNLQSLALSRNPLTTRLPQNMFDGLENLESLFMSNCEIPFIDPSWFRTFGNLRVIFLDNNQINFIPNNTFNNLRSVTLINLSNNFLWEVSSAMFGLSLASLHTINLSNNIINIFDEAFLTSANNLQSLYMADNVCSSQNFIGVADNIESVLNATRQCTQNAVIQPSINCEYVIVGNNQYTCELSLVNPRGGDPFSQISGDHIDQRNDDDVISVVAYRQNSRSVPGTICRQFRNLLDLSIFSSNLQLIDRSSFLMCNRIQVLMLDGGFIQWLPNDIFFNIPNLRYLSMADNRIWAISDFAFAGTSIQILDLAFNRIELVIPRIFDPISKTLTKLNMVGNLMSYFPIDTFENLGHIEELYLDRNPLRELYDETFLTLPNLRILSMAECQLSRLNEVMFYEMVNVHTLRLNGNQIDMLPDGVFHNMTSLEVLYIGNNRLGFLNSIQFGGAMTSIRIINAPDNRINAIDRELILNSPNLSNLLLPGNICVDDTFGAIQDNLEEVLNSLNVCLDNFDIQPEIECTFDVTSLDEYRCDVRIHNPVDENFQSIGGQHLTDRSDNDVLVVSILSQNTKTFPGVICQQFVNVRNILIMDSLLEILEAPAFSECRNLEQILINRNRITIIPPGLFANSPNLRYAALSSNRINLIHPTAFTGTSIEFLDLAGNLIANINPVWFASMNNTLRILDLFENSIVRLQNNAFGQLGNLQTLVLGRNHLELDANPFGGLPNLQHLALDQCSLRELNPLWFSSIPQLSELDLNQNGIAELQNGIFNELPNLMNLQIEDNLLTSVTAGAFGSSLGNVQHLNFIHNILNSIDPELLNGATSLDLLRLQGNICVNQNFAGVANSTDQVREQLQECFDNFN